MRSKEGKNILLNLSNPKKPVSKRKNSFKRNCFKLFKKERRISKSLRTIRRS